VLGTINSDRQGWVGGTRLCACRTPNVGYKQKNDLGERESQCLGVCSEVAGSSSAASGRI